MLKVLNNGYVELIEYMGGDEAVARNARRCWESEDKSNPEADARLIKHLFKKEHKTPFEAMVFTFDVKAPLFVARQWMRHRIGSYAEKSLRYCVADIDFYIPEGLNDAMLETWKNDNYRQFAAYEAYLNQGIPKEQARAILPIGIYTKFYWTVNGSSLINFLKLRLDKAAQKEIRSYAEAILSLTKEVAPITFNLLEGEQ